MSTNSPTETPVFTLEYRNAVDGQWRVTIPADWRFTDRAEFFIQQKPDHLVVFPKSERERFIRWANTLPGSERAQAMEAWAERSMPVKIDGAGRLTLPSTWAKAVGIEVKNDAVLVGGLINFKIWSEARYDAVAKDREARHSAVLARYENATVDFNG